MYDFNSIKPLVYTAFKAQTIHEQSFFKKDDYISYSINLHDASKQAVEMYFSCKNDKDKNMVIMLVYGLAYNNWNELQDIIKYMHKPFALVSEIQEGDIVVTDDGFTCIPPNTKAVVYKDDKGLFICCHGEDGKHPTMTEHHYIDGQIERNYKFQNGADVYIGLYKLNADNL